MRIANRFLSLRHAVGTLFDIAAYCQCGAGAIEINMFKERFDPSERFELLCVFVVLGFDQGRDEMQVTQIVLCSHLFGLDG